MGFDLPHVLSFTASMPAKSNKFDYTKRNNAGQKLGQIIGTSLCKELEKAKKDAEKQQARAEKEAQQRMAKGIVADSSGAADSSPSHHIIDLKAPNKQLGDDGVCAMVEGMEAALSSGNRMASLGLEDLDLSGNELTTAALAHLVRSIQLSRWDLKTLNLAGNKIRVENDEQAQQWESFLEAFGSCHTLRRLDLSNNTGLGSRALETLARVHANEPAIDPTSAYGEGSVVSLADTDFEDDLAEQPDFREPERMAQGTFLKRRCGLRSFPYITLHNIGLDDKGALWLSYVLEDHYYPSQLISDINATSAESAIQTYQQGTQSPGVDWRENKTLGKEGAHLLERTEAVRRHKLLEDVDDLTDSITCTSRQQACQHAIDSHFRRW